jgi:hypothetical protein
MRVDCWSMFEVVLMYVWYVIQMCICWNMLDMFYGMSNLYYCWYCLMLISLAICLLTYFPLFACAFVCFGIVLRRNHVLLGSTPLPSKAPPNTRKRSLSLPPSRFVGAWGKNAECSWVLSQEGDVNLVRITSQRQSQRVQAGPCWMRNEQSATHHGVLVEGQDQWIFSSSGWTLNIPTIASCLAPIVLLCFHCQCTLLQDFAPVSVSFYCRFPM